MSGPRSFRKLGSESREMQKVQQSVQEAIKPVRDSKILDGVLLTNVSLTSGVTNNIEHRLNRKPFGFIVVRKRGAADIWDSQDSNQLANRTFALECDADVEIDIWIF